jgi:hypothetical protein
LSIESIVLHWLLSLKIQNQNNNNHWNLTSMPSNSRRHTPAVLDEAIAAEMQEQYRLDFVRRNEERLHRQRASAPTADIETSRKNRAVSDEEFARRLAQEENERQKRSLTQEERDAALARRLAQGEEVVLGPDGNVTTMSSNRIRSQARAITTPSQEEMDAELAMRIARGDNQANASHGDDADRLMAQRLQLEEVARQRYLRRQGSSRPSSFEDEEDEETRRARQVAQEMEDGELARRYSTYDEYEQGVTRRQLRHLQQTRAARRGWCLRNFPFVCIFLSIIIALLFTFNVIDFSETRPGKQLQDIFDFDDWIDPDPYGEVNITQPEAAFSWENNGAGLELNLLNALDDSWQTAYATALANWENGSPDALSLTTEQIPYESVCDAVTGVMKVCNGDYGDTRYRGINEVLLDKRTNRIFSSAARMNDFYLKRESSAQRQYTMCHELGHGFGLPHWDEDFFNRDLGNCMDYTNNPEKNMKPDESNFQFLADLYGEVGGQVGSQVNGMDQGNVMAPTDDAVVQQQSPQDGVTQGRQRNGGRLRRTMEYEHAVPRVGS